MKLILTLFYCLLLTAATNAQPGSLDYSFGDSGKVISKYFGDCYAMAIQADDKIVCAGINNLMYQVVRYMPGGNIDSSFGNNGVFNPAVQETNNQAATMVLQPDQKILVAGFGYKNGVPTITVIRILPDGSFDKSFGNNGILDSTFGIGESIPHIALQPDGKILVLGWYYPGFIIIRYNTDGTLDKNFGDNGKVITVFGAGTIPTAIAVAPDGKIVTAGNYGGGVGYSKFLLARYNNEGALDESFGNKGVTTTDFGKYGDVINDMTVQPDGKIVVAGQTGLDFDFQNENIAIARYQVTGELDEGFGEAGKATIIFPNFDASAEKVILQSDNKILFAGEIYSLFSSIQDFAVGRLLTDGTIDKSFGNNGETTTDFGLIEDLHGLAIQDNKIIVAGTSYTSEPQTQINYALARYNNDGKSKKQIIITKIKRWLQHRNGFTWNNNSNVNNYVVQRSYDGKNWLAVSSERLAVNSQLSSASYYNDPAPLSGSNFYRLQTTSTNGSVNYSNVIAVTNSDIKISPNPAQNVLHIAGLSSSNAKLTVADFTGNVAISQQLKANSSSSYNLNIASLKQGNYLLKIEMNNEVVTKKFVKE